MNVDYVDHYRVLGLASGEEGAKLTGREISRAYKAKALEVHPDKRPEDPNADAKFRTLKSSYETLMDPASRRKFDDFLRQVKPRKNMEARKASFRATDAKRRKARDHKEKQDARDRKEKQERARSYCTRCTKILEVSWQGKDYREEELREFFSRFGVVEDIWMRKSCRSANVTMDAEDPDAAAAATSAAPPPTITHTAPIHPSSNLLLFLLRLPPGSTSRDADPESSTTARRLAIIHAARAGLSLGLSLGVVVGWLFGWAEVFGWV
ncbi:hypothetical protein Tsubulata_050236 [Turnera subulata]|uniref:J domain-containing protein n=1 Tax=Turnera subulata TaxID=218843 RepID=A0A9Q0FX03_9ROSI|nr:hypothetical protein Tsubulata_050236 [Turnera subulata]